MVGWQSAGRQAGVVSIMVTMIMMIVITLIVLGFAEISRNEQSGSLNDQLSTQAYYAAETGINDVRAIMNAAIKTGSPIQSKPNCSNVNAYASLNPTVDFQHNVSYTCVIINPTPATLSYQIGYSSKIIPIQSATGSSIGKLQLSWGLPDGSDGLATACGTSLTQLDELPTTDAWNCDYPVVRVDLVNTGGILSRGAWAGTTSTMFFMPFSIAVANNVSFPVQGKMVPAQCSAGSCSADITGLGGKSYYMRVTTLYQAGSHLSISSPGNTFAGAQATIDATGKARDVLRRVLVAVDLTDANTDKTPNGALVVEDSICKRFGTANNYFEVYDNVPGDGGNLLCTTRNYGSPKP